MRAALVALVLAALFVAGRARADEAPCTAMVHDWVGRAASAGHTRMIAVACAPERVRVRLEPDGAEPYEVEVAEGPGPAFRRVGRFRLSPLLVVNDWRTLPAPQRDAFDALSGWIDAHEGDVRFVAGRIPTPARAVLRPFGVRTRYAWMVVVALLLVFATRLGAPPPIAREDRIACGAFFVAAFALRVALGMWGPHHPGLAPLWILGGTTDANELVHYGPGYAELFTLLTAPLRPAHVAPDHALYATNALLSALVPPLAYVLARFAGIDARRAWLPAMLFAAEPVSIRIAASESYFPGIVALCVAGAVCLLAAADAWFAPRRSRADRARAFAFAMAGGLLVAQASCIHPIAWSEAGLVPLAAVASRRTTKIHERFLFVGAAYAVVALLVLVTSGSQLLGVLNSLTSGELARTRPVPTVTPALVSVLVCAVAALLARPRWLPLVAAPHLAIAAVTRVQYTMEGALWMESYDTLVFVMPIIALASLVPERVAKHRAAPLAIATIVAFLVAYRLADVRGARSTNHLEDAWIRAWMTQLPAECRTLHVAFAGHQDLFLPTYAASARPQSAFVRLDLRHDIDLASALGAIGCTFYLHTSLCSTEQGSDACARIESQLELVPVTGASFPAVPRDRFVGDPIESVIYRAVALR